MAISNSHIGSSLDEFLESEDIQDACQAEAVKYVIAWQVGRYLSDNQISKSAFANALGTSRSQVDRLLDPNNTSVTLKTLASAAALMGKRLELVIN